MSTPPGFTRFFLHFDSRKRPPPVNVNLCLDILGGGLREFRLYLIFGSSNKGNFSLLRLFRRLWYSNFKFGERHLDLEQARNGYRKIKERLFFNGAV